MVVFFGAGITFAVAPDWTINYIEKIGSGIFNWSSTPVQLGGERFWLVLVTSLMATITFLAFRAQANLLRNIGDVGVIIVAKFVSTVGFIVCLVLVQMSFIYLAGAVIDGLIFLITAGLYHAALKSRPRM